MVYGQLSSSINYIRCCSNDTPETSFSQRGLVFDFQKNNTQKIVIDGKTFEMKLQGIGTNKQKFPKFEFLVTEL